MCTRNQSARTNRSYRLTAPQSPTIFWSPNSSAMKKARLQGRMHAASENSKKQTAARCCSMKYPRWMSACRRSSCASYRNALSTASAVRNPSRSIFASSRPPDNPRSRRRSGAPVKRRRAACGTRPGAPCPPDLRRPQRAGWRSADCDAFCGLGK